MCVVCVCVGVCGMCMSICIKKPLKFVNQNRMEGEVNLAKKSVRFR